MQSKLAWSIFNTLISRSDSLMTFVTIFRNRGGPGRFWNCFPVFRCSSFIRQRVTCNRKCEYYQKRLYNFLAQYCDHWIPFFFQILFIVGLSCVIGLERTFRFFFQRHKAKASAAFFGGIFVVLLGWPLVGMVVETYGFVLLFRWVIFPLKNL